MTEAVLCVADVIDIWRTAFKIAVYLGRCADEAWGTAPERGNAGVLGGYLAAGWICAGWAEGEGVLEPETVLVVDTGCCGCYHGAG